MDRSERFKNLWLIPTGALAGLVNGLLGTGGGTVILLFSLARKKGKGDVSKRDDFASTMCVILILSLCSLFIYFKGGHIDLTYSLRYLIPAVPGGMIGALLLDRVSARFLKIGFSLLLIISGGVMLLR